MNYAKNTSHTLTARGTLHKDPVDYDEAGKLLRAGKQVELELRKASSGTLKADVYLSSHVDKPTAKTLIINVRSQEEPENAEEELKVLVQSLRKAIKASGEGILKGIKVSSSQRKTRR
jgi:hypothetical protein